MLIAPQLRPYIAKLNGVDWKLFDSVDDAVKAVDEMIGKNRTEHPWIDTSKDEHSVANPALCSKFFYCHAAGIVHTSGAIDNIIRFTIYTLH